MSDQLLDMGEPGGATPGAVDDAALLNSGCFCISLDKDALHRALESALGSTDLAQLVEERCPHAFAARPVFLSDAHRKSMEQLIHAVEYVVAMPSFRRHVLAAAPAIAQHDPGGAKGVFFGYDFHLHDQGVGLIEINTNAGGAMLNAALARAQRACCAAIEKMLPPPDSAAALETRIVGMFRREWALSGRERPLRRIAIVDESPQQQYLYPEFLLFRQLFQRHGWQVAIADPSELRWHEGGLWYQGMALDMVYNRLTDFLLEAPASAALRAAYLANAVVLTPHPQAHALYADKRNLALLSDVHRLQQLGVPEKIQAILLSGIPRTEIVNTENAERLWAGRRQLFFKPTAGYGGRAAYRGDKLTKRVWQEILAGGYVAQSVVAPGERIIDPRDRQRAFKFDVRNYVYEGGVQWMAARLYQGQTTNFRTPGGGFAPVYGLPASDAAHGCLGR